MQRNFQPDRSDGVDADQARPPATTSPPSRSAPAEVSAGSPAYSTVCIITTCMTGEGSAIKIAEYIEKTIPGITEARIKAIPLNIESAVCPCIRDKIKSRVLAVVGTVDPGLAQTPFISLEELVLGDGIRKLRSLVETASLPPASDAALIEQKTHSLLKETTMFIDVEKVIAVGTKAFESLSLPLSPARQRSLRIRFLLHLSCMLERVLQKIPLESQPETADSAADAIPHYAALRLAMQRVEAAFNVTIPDAEIRFLEDLIYTVPIHTE
jgi:transcriptional regulatory protein LevR